VLIRIYGFLWNTDSISQKKKVTPAGKGSKGEPLWVFWNTDFRYGFYGIEYGFVWISMESAYGFYGLALIRI
jgi:hypothetical protein